MQLFLSLSLLLTATTTLVTQHSVSTTIHFHSNQHHLTNKARIELAKTLKDVPLHNIIRVAIIGHTDSDGDIVYNQKLSERRSNATLLYLIKAGINKDKVEIYSKGEVEPKADNSTLAGKAINRRVELTIIYKID